VSVAGTTRPNWSSPRRPRATLAKWARQGKVTPTQVLPNGDRRWDLADLRRQLDELARREREQ